MNIKQYKDVIGLIGKEFDSHDFIRMVLSRFPKDYGELLVKHESVTRTNAEISLFLENHSKELGIQRNGDRESEDLFKNNVLNANWKK